ncbi:DUF1189 domain-containing protein [Bacillus alkalicellulosilyticus]|uniref:DUF1189 domain-containing protein n=1 Tax=Alkalihalobacterium alkalicellulosilyticum TaxID=1912214 RepID=UPI000996B8BD|nr:DUF1189 domain-containing protein [Bacillus alkalicellulosilyticus]
MNIFLQFIKSLHSPKDIALFRFQGIGKTILFVFLLMAITSLPIGINFSLFVSNGVQSLQEGLSNEIPDFEIQSSVLYSDLDEPFINQGDEGVFILDPTGELTSRDIAQYGDGFALLEREAVMVIDGDPESIPYSDLGNIDFTKADIEVLITSLGDLLPIIIPVILIVLYLFFTAMKFIGITFLGVIGLILRKDKKNLQFRHLWILSAYAVVLPTTIFAVLDFLGITLPYSFAFYWVIAVVMLSQVIKHVPKPKTPTASNDQITPAEKD